MNNRPTYPLLPFSQLVYDMSRLTPKVYTFGCSLRCPGEAPHTDRIKQAFRTAIANHPVFSMRVDWRGRHFPSVQKDILHGRFHDFDISTQGDDVYIHVRFNRILGDGKSLDILAEDIARTYQGLSLEPDDYWTYIAHYEAYKHDARYAASHDWLTDKFADTSVPVRPAIDCSRLFTILPPKAGMLTDDYTNLSPAIQSLAAEHYLSMDGFFCLCTALAIAEYCGTDEAALTWAYEGREHPEEQRIFGSLHRDVPFMIRRSNNREELIRMARDGMRAGIAHSDYPFTLTKPYSARWNYAVNVLRITDAEELLKDFPLPFELLPAPPQKIAYALLDVEIHEHQNSLQICYNYSATHYKEESIRRFAGLVRKYAEWLRKD